MQLLGNRRRKRILIWLALFLIMLSLLFPFVVNARVISTGEKRILTVEDAAGEDADCILVLGAFVYQDGTLSAVLEDRVKTAIDLYKKGAAKKLLFSGDHGRTDYDEVNAMKRYAMEAGVPEEDIFMDHAGFSTYESVHRAQSIFDAKKIIIVTQEYHLYRALYVASSLGLEAVGVDGALQRYSDQKKQDVREFLARNKEFVQCLFKPDPTFLGDVIPIEGDGRATNG